MGPAVIPGFSLPPSLFCQHSTGFIGWHLRTEAHPSPSEIPAGQNQLDRGEASYLTFPTVCLFFSPGVCVCAGMCKRVRPSSCVWGQAGGKRVSSTSDKEWHRHACAHTHTHTHTHTHVHTQLSMKGRKMQLVYRRVPWEAHSHTRAHTHTQVALQAASVHLVLLPWLMLQCRESPPRLDKALDKLEPSLLSFFFSLRLS